MTDIKKEMSSAEREALANIPASALADMVKVGSADPMADRAAYASPLAGRVGRFQRTTVGRPPVGPIHPRQRRLVGKRKFRFNRSRASTLLIAWSRTRRRVSGRKRSSRT